MCNRELAETGEGRHGGRGETRGKHDWGINVLYLETPSVVLTRVRYPRTNQSRTNHPNSTLLYRDGEGPGEEIGAVLIES